MLIKLWDKVRESAMQGGLGYFFATIIFVSIRVVTLLATPWPNSPFIEIMALLFSIVASLVVCVPFLFWFNTYTEKKWGWKYILVEGKKEILAVICWAIAGSLVGTSMWFLGFVVF